MTYSELTELEADQVRRLFRASCNLVLNGRNAMTDAAVVPFLNTVLAMRGYTELRDVLADLAAAVADVMPVWTEPGISIENCPPMFTMDCSRKRWIEVAVALDRAKTAFDGVPA